MLILCKGLQCIWAILVPVPKWVNVAGFYRFLPVMPEPGFRGFKGFKEKGGSLTAGKARSKVGSA
jgi:hypothetical protein